MITFVLTIKDVSSSSVPEDVDGLGGWWLLVVLHLVLVLKVLLVDVHGVVLSDAVLHHLDDTGHTTAGGGVQTCR